MRLCLRMMGLVVPLLLAATLALLLTGLRLRRLVWLVMHGRGMLRPGLRRHLPPGAHLGGTHGPRACSAPRGGAAGGQRRVGVVGAELHHHWSVLLRVGHVGRSLRPWRGKASSLRRGVRRRGLYMELLIWLQAPLGERGVTPGGRPPHVDPYLRSPSARWHMVHKPTTRWRGAVRVALLLVRHDRLRYPGCHGGTAVRVSKVGVWWTGRRMPGSHVSADDRVLLRVTKLPGRRRILRVIASGTALITLGARGPCRRHGLAVCSRSARSVCQQLCSSSRTRQTTVLHWCASSMRRFHPCDIPVGYPNPATDIRRRINIHITPTNE